MNIKPLITLCAAALFSINTAANAAESISEFLTDADLPKITVTEADQLEAHQSGDRKKIARVVCTYIAENTAALIMQERQNGEDKAMLLSVMAQLGKQAAYSTALVKQAYTVPIASTHEGKKAALDAFVLSANQDCFDAAVL
ncbi:hypothetical protein VST7929_00627 [Vibrio stylophorae]|uniref:Excinuclease ABC subunit A n=1 Tax=Vibrio stylophorae TaxID=659351 RepID=A0ABM8ZR52_9VIBR|nr:hypothetical protein [Vibrio stylophorae]CAH0532781.1 hypothetical protein VST7929_00627 [Vibrio stylophorae]